MTILESIRESIISGNISKIKQQHMLISYILLHMENPGLHPDDYLYDDSGYAGWMVLLVDKTLTNKTVPDNFQYPCSFGKIGEVLDELQSFHENNDEDVSYFAAVNDLIYWFENPKPSELCGVVDDLQKLYLYHAFEGDTTEEEAEKPAGILKDCADVLNWILTKGGV
jgi:hypothetical protein